MSKRVISKSLTRIQQLPFLALLLCSFCSLSDESSPSKKLKLLSNPVPFFSYTDKSGEMTGYSIDLSKNIIKNAGFDVEVEGLPWARVLKRAESVEYSVISGIVRTPEREDSYYWITPISSNPVAFYTLKEDHIFIESIKELDALGNIGVLRNDYRHRILTDENAANIMAFNNWPVAIHSLLKHRTKSLFFSDMGLVLTCLDANINCTSIERIHTYKNAVSYIAVRKTETLKPVYEALKNAAEQFKQSNEFNAMVASYLNQSDDTAKLMTVENGIVSVKSNTTHHASNEGQ